MRSQSQYGSRTVAIWPILLTLTMMLCFLAVACGGGGGDGGGGSAPGINYSGLTTPAVITEENAKTIAGSALDSGSSADGFSGIASLDNAAQVPQNGSKPFLTDLSKAAKEVIEQINFESATETNTRAALENVSDTVYGSCGGNAPFTIRVDTVTGAFTGNMTFVNYCEEGMTVNGNTTFYGTVDLNTEEIASFTFNFDNLTGTSGSESITMDGQVDYRQSGSTIYMTMNMAIQDNNKTDYVCKVEDYQMALTDRFGSSDLDISGRFFEPDYGYVVLDTLSVLSINDTADYPHSGVVTLTGNLGIAGGATKARLTALSETQCQVEADTNGDGSYDYDSGAISWTELDTTQS